MPKEKKTEGNDSCAKRWREKKRGEMIVMPKDGKKKSEGK